MLHKPPSHMSAVSLGLRLAADAPTHLLIPQIENTHIFASLTSCSPHILSLPQCMAHTFCKPHLPPTSLLSCGHPARHMTRPCIHAPRRNGPQTSLHSSPIFSTPVMCMSNTCNICKNKSWIGCGLHIPSVMDKVDKSEWCTCKHADGSESKYPPKASTGVALT